MWLTHPSPISHTHQPASQPHNRFELRTLHKNTVQLHNAMQTGGILILLLSTSLQPTRSHLIPSIPFPTEVGWSSHPPSGSSRSPKQASKQASKAGRQVPPSPTSFPLSLPHAYAINCIFLFRRPTFYSLQTADTLFYPFDTYILKTSPSAPPAV